MPKLFFEEWEAYTKMPANEIISELEKLTIQGVKSGVFGSLLFGKKKFLGKIYENTFNLTLESIRPRGIYPTIYGLIEPNENGSKIIVAFKLRMPARIIWQSVSIAYGLTAIAIAFYNIKSILSLYIILGAAIIYIFNLFIDSMIFSNEARRTIGIIEKIVNAKFRHLRGSTAA